MWRKLLSITFTQPFMHKAHGIVYVRSYIGYNSDVIFLYTGILGTVWQDRSWYIRSSGQNPIQEPRLGGVELIDLFLIPTVLT